MSTGAPRQPLTTKEGWNAFVSRSSRPEPPRLLAKADLERLDPDERELYDYARMDYHSELNLINTPDIRKIITVAADGRLGGGHGQQKRGLPASGIKPGMPARLRFRPMGAPGIPWPGAKPQPVPKAPRAVAPP